MSDKELVKRSDSGEQLKNYTPNNDEGTVFPDFSFDKTISMIDSDPVARGAFNHFIDKCMEGDYNIITRADLEYSPKDELRLDEKFLFRHNILRKLYIMLKLFNNAFVEIVRTTDGQTKSLNVLDSTNIDAITKPNGDPIKFKSKIQNIKTGGYTEWSTDRITWYKIGDRTEGWAPIDMKALFMNLLAKEYVLRFTAWLWKTGQYRQMFHFDSASNDDVEAWLSRYRATSIDFKKPSISKGGTIETKVLRDMKEMESIDRILKYYDSQTLILLRVPPIDAGIPDASGRSNADAQSNSLSTTITSMKKVIEDVTNFDLFPKINKSTLLLRFAPNDRFSEEQVFKNLQIMQSIGMSEEAMKEYMGDRGLFYKSRLFKPIEMQNATGNPRNIDTAPSRTGKTPGAGNKKIGTGSQSTTRKDQL